MLCPLLSTFRSMSSTPIVEGSSPPCQLECVCVCARIHQIHRPFRNARFLMICFGKVTLFGKRCSTWLSNSKSDFPNWEKTELQGSHAKRARVEAHPPPKAASSAENRAKGPAGHVQRASEKGSIQTHRNHVLCLGRPILSSSSLTPFPSVAALIIHPQLYTGMVSFGFVKLDTL